MSLSVYMKGDYEELFALEAAKKQSQSKPKQSQSPAFGRKSEALSSKSETDRMEAERKIPAHLKGCDLKKQSQFA